MKTQTSILTVSLAAVLLVGCEQTLKDEQVTVPPVVIEVGAFDFATSHPLNLAVRLLDPNGDGMGYTRMSLYLQNPIIAENGTLSAEVSPLVSGITNANGVVNLLSNVPTTAKELYAVVFSLGYQSPTVISWNGTPSQNVTITPLAYQNASSQSAPALAAITKAEDGNYNIQHISGGLYSLGTWNSQGVPNWRVATRDVVTSSMLHNLNNSVPEFYSVVNIHPEFFSNPAKANIDIIEDAQIWTTFVSEGAGYRSVMGYFTYPTNDPPKSAAEIKQRMVVFPNVSFVNSGGGLVSGDKVQLLYKDGDSYTPRFPAGTSIGWFINPDGYGNNNLASGMATLYSFDKFNPGQKQQTLVLDDPENKVMYITFEDITRTSGSCDNDFNDVVFYCTSSPYEAVNHEGVPVVTPPKDTDKDGVPDYYDEYPTDPQLAFNSYYPAKGVYGTLAYEDLWPATGDYDFNDLVVDVNILQQLNAQNNVVRIKPSYRLRAIGASYHNGFALALKTTSGKVKSVTGQRMQGRGVFNLSSNGTELAVAKAVIPVFEDGYAIFGNKPFTNTVPGETYMDPVQMDLVIEFTTPISQSELGTAPFDPFIVINGARSREVHLMNNNPTSMADMSYFGTEKDVSNPSRGIYYVSKDGHPWAISIITSFDYPVEKASISAAHKHFDAWATSLGTTYKDWYKNLSGYRDATLIYNK